MALVLYSVILLYLSFNHLEVYGAIMLKLVLSYVFGISVCMIFWPLGLRLPGLGGDGSLVSSAFLAEYNMESLCYLVGLLSHVIRRIII